MSESGTVRDCYVQVITSICMITLTQANKHTDCHTVQTWPHRFQVKKCACVALTCKFLNLKCSSYLQVTRAVVYARHFYNTKRHMKDLKTSDFRKLISLTESKGSRKYEHWKKFQVLVLVCDCVKL